MGNKLDLEDQREIKFDTGSRLAMVIKLLHNCAHIRISRVLFSLQLILK